MTPPTVGFLGSGRMARILIQAWKTAGQMPAQILVYDPAPDRSATLAAWDPEVVRATATAEEACQADVVFLAVHPPVLVDLLTQIRGALRPDTLVISLAPKHSLTSLQSALGGHHGVARVNPSAPGMIGAGINPWCATPSTTIDQGQLLQHLFTPLGTVRKVEEPKIESYALISAMGPTYFWFQWKALQDLAIEFGMDPEEAATTVEEMVHGAVRTLFHSGLPADVVQDLVPVKPLGDLEPTIVAMYQERLPALFAKIRPAATPTGS